MALSLAACGGSSTTTTNATDTTTTTTTTTTDAAQSIALTIAADTVTGGSGADAISGARVDGIVTLNASDVVDGGAGVDTLTARTVEGLATSSISNVENVVFTETGACGDTIVFSTAAATYISGVTSITNLASTNNLTFGRVTETADLTVNNSATTTTLQFADSVLTGTADSITVNLNAATAAVTVGTVTDADGDYETLVINASGAASDLVAGGGLGGDATTVDVNASVAVDLGTTASFAALTSFDASDSTAGVTAVFANKAAAGTTAVSITGGAGADNFDISALTAANHGAVTLDMGAGNDTLVLDDKGAVDFALSGGAGTGDKVSISVVSAVATHGTISGFEELITTDVIANAATTTLDMANFVNSDFTKVTMSNTFADATTGAVTDVFAITNAKDGLATLSLNALDLTDASVTFARQTDGTANALTIVSSVASAAGSIAANDEETLTFDSSAGAMDYTAVSATDMTTLVVKGDEQMDLGTLTGTILASVDATGLEDSDGANADFIFDMSSSTVNMTVTGNASSTHGGDMQITTGSGADTITGTKQVDTIDAGAGADNVSGGAGADVITGGTGDDTLTGGAGADVFNYDAAFGDDTITDFTAGASGDVLDFQAFGSVTTAVTLGGIALTNNKVTVADETTANDTAAEIDALFEALTDSTAVAATVTYTNIYVAVSGSTGTVYDVTTADSSGDNGLSTTVVELGTIDLGSTSWSSLTAANFDM